MPSQESERSCICVFGVSILSLSTIFLLECGTVPTVCYFYVSVLHLIKMTSLYKLNCFDTKM